MTTDDAGSFGVAFPGQGNKRPAMIDALRRYRTHDVVAAFLERFGDNPEALDYDDTTVAQPATYAAGIAAAQAAFGEHPAVPLVIGHSLGELTAAACAGVIDVWDGFRLAVRRGEMSREHGRGGAMAAIMGARGPSVEWLRRNAIARSGGVLEIAGLNSSRQTVLTGDLPTVEAALAIAGEMQLLAQILPIGGSFHSPLLADALPHWRAEVEAVPFHRPRSRYVSTADAEVHEEPAEIRELLIRALLLPVRWIDAVRTVQTSGIGRLYDAGPGDALTKLGRREGVVRFAPLPAPANTGRGETAVEALT